MELQSFGATWLLKACQGCLFSGSSFWGLGLQRPWYSGTLAISFLFGHSTGSPCKGDSPLLGST